MHASPLFLTAASTLTAAVAPAQVNTAPTARVPAPVTSSPFSPFGAPAPQLPPLPPPLPAPDPGPLGSIPDRPTAAPGPTIAPPSTAIEGERTAPQVPAVVPLMVDVANDPVLLLGRTAGASDAFRAAIAAAVRRNPVLAEAEAQADEARAARAEARAGMFPTADVNITGYSTVSRDFGPSVDNIIERSRPRARTDAQVAINQTLVDFGTTSSRISAANARLRAAAADMDDATVRIALATVGAWYDVFTFRTLLHIGRTYREALEARRQDFAQRIREGASAPVDVARLDSSLATLDGRLARYRRAVANAEARFTQLSGQPVPPTLLRAPFLGSLPLTMQDARAAVDHVPAVQAADAQAEAARGDARAASSDILPKLSTGIDAGRYGVFEPGPDYDVRARLSLRLQIGGAQDARRDQIRARAAGARARSDRVREEAARDAVIAWTDVQALRDQTGALEQSYIAARLSRDATEQRFRVARGTLFDLIDANDAWFLAASNYVENLADRDAAHYALLARTGGLLNALGLDRVHASERR